MVGFDRGATLADRFRAHAGEQTHLYGYALRGLADDFEANGPTRAVFRGYEDAPSGSVVQLRLLAGVFRLVLTGRAPELEPYYPCLGGTAPPADVWPVLRRVITDHLDELHASLLVAPQTNEIGRAVALLVGLFDVARASGRQRVRLLELGASAGLNLLLPRFRISAPGWAWGPADSPVQLRDAVEGVVEGEPNAVGLEIVTAYGCDLDPVDATSPEGRLRLTSFVWPFDLHRHERLAGALALAADHPPVVDRASASAWIADRLAGCDDDTLTVVWHSVTQLYWPVAEIAAVDSSLSAYGRVHPLAEVALEYDTAGASGDWPRVWTRLWAGDGTRPRYRLLGSAHDHGLPVRLTPVG